MKNKLLKLEGLRGFAALYVLVDHLFLGRILEKSSPWIWLLDWGFEVVMLFFLLSGFVIFYSQSRHRDQTFSGYLFRRFKRIYPIYIFALLATYAANCLSAHAWLPLNFGNLLGNIFMLQDTAGFKPGVHIDTFGGNVSLWSLSYEWWFYLMFWPLYRYVKPTAQLPVAATLSAGGGLLYLLLPNPVSLFLLYFVIWWCGVELARTYSAGKMPGFANQMPTLAILGVFCLGLALTRAGASPPAALLAHAVFRQFFSSLLFVVVGLVWAGMRFKGFSFIPRCFAWAAPISYALYALHYPLVVTANYLLFIPSPTGQILGYIIVVFALSYWCEIFLQRFINKRLVFHTAIEPPGL